MSRETAGESRAGVALTNLDQPLFDGAEATKRDLVDYLDAVCDRILPELRCRPLSVIRVRTGQRPFMQKNVPSYTPDWVPTTTVWAEASRREVTYALCDDRRTLLWFANQRAVEYHPTLVCAGAGHATHLVLDLNPPAGDAFPHAVRAALLVRQTLADAGLASAVRPAGSRPACVRATCRPGANRERRSGDQCPHRGPSGPDRPSTGNARRKTTRPHPPAVMTTLAEHKCPAASD